jgi:PHD/YefM family antitoxin component YafN of YafNO toxin-antitoxin module
MIDISRDIHPRTDFKRNTREYLSQMKETQRTAVLTVNGKAELVVQDAVSYQKSMDRLALLEAIDAIRLGVADAEAGKKKPARSALKKLQSKLAIPD